MEVSLDPPETSACDACCDGCGDARVLVAVITTAVDDGGQVTLTPDETVRRPLGLAQLTTIAGTSWTHGATYRLDDADTLLERGIAIRFSAPVRADALSDPHLVEIGVHTGGSGGRDSFAPRTVRVAPGEVDDEGMTRELWFRVQGYDRLSEGDLVRIAVHCEFLLDHCCRAVDGDHVGGRVPSYEPDSSPYPDWQPIPPEQLPPAPAACASPPFRRGPWETGNGTPGGTFRSWIQVVRRDEEGRS